MSEPGWRLLDELRERTWAIAPEWVALSCAAKRIPLDDHRAGEEWLAGPMAVLRWMRLARGSLAAVAETGAPRLPGRPRREPDGRVSVPVFPGGLRDALLAPGLRMRAVMGEAVDAGALAEHMAVAHRGPAGPTRTVLVLGGGNVSSIPMLDALYKIFAERKRVLLKLSPVNEYLAGPLEHALRPLIAGDWLQIVRGGEDVGRRLVGSASVDEIHVTGSDKTYEAIVRAAPPGRPVTAELGCVMPVLVVPGRWSSAEVAYQAEHLATMIANNAGFNCVAARVIVLWEGWPQREELLDALREALQRTPTRFAYYPGAHDRYAAFTAAHPDALRVGRPSDGELPWTLIDVPDPADDEDICFRTESFCSVAATVAMPAPTPEAFLDAAVELANERLWGTLAVTLLAAPASVPLDRAVARLRYGFVGVNVWSGVAYALGATPWGAAPGHGPADIQSGTGVVHNAYLLSGTEKSIAVGPFRTRVTPAWSCFNRQAHRIGRHLSALEARPGPWRFAPLAAAAALG